MTRRATGAALTGVAALMTLAAAAHGQERMAPIRPGAPLRPMVVAPANRPALGATPVVRITGGMSAAQVLTLRDDQTVETPSGRRISVGRYRRLSAMFANARAHTAQVRSAPFVLLPAPASQGAPRRAGEGAAQLLARPGTDVIRLPSGHGVSVAQLKIIATWLQQHGRLNVTQASAGRPLVAGPATHISGLGQLETLPRSAPDGMVLESPHGVRVTVGELRTVLSTQRPRRPRMLAPRGAQ